VLARLDPRAPRLRHSEAPGVCPVASAFLLRSVQRFLESTAHTAAGLQTRPSDWNTGPHGCYVPPGSPVWTHKTLLRLRGSRSPLPEAHGGGDE